jgi:hypothetical protein
MNSEHTNANPVTTLEAMVANSCFCKLRESCADKESSECMRERNIYQEFMLAKNQ